MATQLLESAAGGVGRLLRRYASDLGVEHAYLALAESGGLSQCLDVGGNLGPVPPDLAPFVERIVERGGTLLIDDLRADSVVRASVEAEYEGSLLGVGATGDLGELLGILIARGHTPRSWTNADLERAGDLARALASFLAIDQQRRHAQRRVQAEIVARELRLQMHTIASGAASAATLTELAMVLVTEVPKLLGCDWTVIGTRSVQAGWEVHSPDALQTQFSALFEAEVAPGRTLLDDVAQLDTNRHDFSTANREDFPIIQAAFLDRHTALISAVPLTQKHGVSVVMVCGFSTEDLSVRTEYLFDELIRDAQRAVERAASAQQQISAAETLQRSLLPPRIPDLDGFKIRRLYKSAADHTRVGGDWYDIVQIADEITGFVVGDVAGHDVRSAALMGQLRHVLASQLRDRGTPAGALASTDRYFADLAEDIMATAVVIVVDRVRHETTLALAGHPPPVLIADGTPRLCTAEPGPPIGFGYAGYVDTSIRFATGDTLVAYTDGVVENQGGDLSELLIEFVHELRGAGADVDDLINFLDHRSQRSEPVDDVAALVVQML